MKISMNLSSSNFICWGWKTDNGQSTYLKIGNTKDQWQFYMNDSLVLNGIEQEFNLSQFTSNFRFWIQNDSFWIRYKSPTGNTIQQFLSKSNKSQILFTSGFLFIQQYGISAIGKHQFFSIYSGKKLLDTLKPSFIKLTQIDNHQFQIQFNTHLLKLDSTKLIGISGKITHISEIKSTPTLYLFNYSPSHQKQDSICFILKDIQSENLNYLKFLEVKSYYNFCDTPRFSDVILTEIMHHPDALNSNKPSCKFIEIWNPTNKKIDLQNCKLQDNSATFAIFPHYCFQPKEVLILCNKIDSGKFNGLHFLGLDKFPILNQTSDKIKLTNSIDNLLFEVNYSEKWHEIEYIDGGYSLIKKNLNHPENEYFNWVSCPIQNGTPGELDSTKNTLFEPKIIECYLENDTINLRTNFTIPPTDTTLLSCNKIQIKTHQISGNTIKGIFSPSETKNIVQFGTVKSILKERLYESDKLKFNEILFHNYTQFPDFIEIINMDTAPIQLSNYTIEIYDNNNYYKSQFSLSNTERKCILPNETIAFSNYSIALTQEYSNSHCLDNIIYLDNFPGFSAFGGTLKLKNSITNKFIDEMSFNESMHSPFIASGLGISLEKNDPNSASSNPLNWSSTPEIYGKASPGILNSTQLLNIEYPKSSAHFNIFKRKIIQYNYGNNDPIKIDYVLPQSGYWLQADLFNSDGYKICCLTSKMQLLKDGYILFYPNLNNQPLKTDNYIIKFEAILPNQDICREKIRISIINK